MTTPEGPADEAEIAVVIPHYNDHRRLAACLDALGPQVGDGGVETVVVDNASPGGMGEIARRFPFARIVTETAKGAAPTRSRGALETTAPVIAFLDADCVPAPDWIAAIRAAATDPHTVLGGRIEIFDETQPPRSGAEAFERVFAFDQEGYIARKGFAVTANLIVPRAVWEATGPFRAGVSEDVDWCHRACAAGARLVYAPQIAVGHPARADWAALRAKWRRLTDEGFALEGAQARASWALKALLMPASAVAHVPRLLGTRALGRGEKGRGLLTLARLRLLRMVWMLGQAVRGR